MKARLCAWFFSLIDRILFCCPALFRQRGLQASSVLFCHVARAHYSRDPRRPEAAALAGSPRDPVSYTFWGQANRPAPSIDRIRMARKVIITCAVTGSIHTPTMSPYLPVTPAEIADSLDRGGRGGRCHHPFACTRPRDRSAKRQPRSFHAISAPDQGRMRRTDQYFDRWQFLDVAGRTAGPGASGPA